MGMDIIGLTEIVNLVNILLGLLLGVLCIRYTKFYSYLNAWWRRMIALAYVFILAEVAAFVEFPLIAALTKTFFVIYFIYLISYITPMIKHLHEAEEEVGLLKKRLAELKSKETAGE